MSIAIPETLLPDHTARSSGIASMAGWLLCFGAIVACFGMLPTFGSDLDELQRAGAIGIIGIWRWSWIGMHFVRMLIYSKCTFPRLRREAQHAAMPPTLSVIVTSYRMSAELNAAVYGALFDELERVQVPAFIVACITDPADAVVLRMAFNNRPGLVEGTILQLLAQDGTGKRSAMARAMELVAARRPLPGSQVVLMDGDTLLSPGSLEKTCRLLASQSSVGAVTTNNVPIVQGSAVAREWYRLRMAQRHSLMCSMSLSRRLLVLTGRFSVFRAELAMAPDFKCSLEYDSLEHWRAGTIRMLTGDDKSTWFVALRRGWQMLYVPDAVAYCIEELPSKGFVRATTALMMRWYGNMARNNTRARRLGRKPLGTFIWLCLIDQRLSPWTAMTGPTIMLYAAVTQNVAFIPLYALWVLATRTFIGFLDFVATGKFHPLFPFLLYYNQFVGALLKIFMAHYPQKQRWTRQKLNQTPGERGPPPLSAGFLSLSGTAFLLVLAIIGGALTPHLRAGKPTGLDAILDGRAQPQESLRAVCGTARSHPCAAIRVVPRPPIVRIPQSPHFDP